MSMADDKRKTGKVRALKTIGDMLGLTGEPFKGAMREAVWVPGGVDQLADMIIRSLSSNDLVRLIDELPDFPEVMALIGRLLIALNDHPDREAVGHRVTARARVLGSEAMRFLSPHAWYPSAEHIDEILVTPYRLHGASVMVRMKWGGQFAGIEALWMLRFAAGLTGEVYFMNEEPDQGSFDDMLWQSITMDQALGLIALVGMVQSAVNNRSPFDDMTGVGLWMVLAGGREVRPWIDCSYALEHEPLDAVEVALVYVNALNSEDYLAAYDVLDTESRPQDVLAFIAGEVESLERQGTLWRLEVFSDECRETDADVKLYQWFWTGIAIEQRELSLHLRVDDQEHWRIQRVEALSATPLPDRVLQAYLTRHHRFYGLYSVSDIDALAHAMDMDPEYETESVVGFSSGPEFDYRRPFDIGNSSDLDWIVLLEGKGELLVFARDEILFRREVSRLQQQQLIGNALQTGTADLLRKEQMELTAEQGSEALGKLLETF